MRHPPFSPLSCFLVAFADRIQYPIFFCWQGSSLASAHCNDEVSISWKQQPIQSCIIHCGKWLVDDFLMISFRRPESSCFSMPPGKLCTELQLHHGSKLGAGCFCWGKTRLALLCGPTASFGHSAHDTRCRMVRISTWFVIGNGLLLNSWTSNCRFVSYSKLDTSRSNRAACLRMTVQKLAESTTKLGVRPKAAQKNCIDIFASIFAAPKKNTQITIKNNAMFIHPDILDSLESGLRIELVHGGLWYLGQCSHYLLFFTSAENSEATWKASEASSSSAVCIGLEPAMSLIFDCWDCWCQEILDQWEWLEHRNYMEIANSYFSAKTLLVPYQLLQDFVCA